MIGLRILGLHNSPTPKAFNLIQVQSLGKEYPQLLIILTILTSIILLGSNMMRLMPHYYQPQISTATRSCKQGLILISQLLQIPI